MSIATFYAVESEAEKLQWLQWGRHNHGLVRGPITGSVPLLADVVHILTDVAGPHPGPSPLDPRREAAAKLAYSHLRLGTKEARGEAKQDFGAELVTIKIEDATARAEEVVLHV